MAFGLLYPEDILVRLREPTTGASSSPISTGHDKAVPSTLFELTPLTYRKYSPPSRSDGTCREAVPEDAPDDVSVLKSSRSSSSSSIFENAYSILENPFEDAIPDHVTVIFSPGE